LFSMSGLRIVSSPTSANETDRLSTYPEFSEGSYPDRMAYNGVEKDGVAEDDQSKVGYSTQVWWRRITVVGRLSDINRALSQAIYAPAHNWNSELLLFNSEHVANHNSNRRNISIEFEGFDIFNLTVAPLTDNADNSITNSKIIKFHVFAVNDNPVIHVSRAVYHPTLLTDDLLTSAIVESQIVYTDEDTPVEILNTSIRDVDIDFGEGFINTYDLSLMLGAQISDAFVKLTLEPVHGRVSVSWQSIAYNKTLSMRHPNDGISAGVTFEHGSGDNDKLISVIGPLSIINQIMRVITFIPEKDYYGVSANLTITVDDMGNHGIGGSKSDSHTIRIYISPQNDAPEITLPYDHGGGGKIIFTLDEGEFQRIYGAKYNPLKGITTGTLGWETTWQSGMELWRVEEFFEESSVAIGTYANPASRYYGQGQLNWNSRQLADIKIGRKSSNPRFLCNYQGSIFFQADDGVHGPEMWRDDGLTQTAGAQEAMDLENGLFDPAGQGGRGWGSVTQFLDLFPGPRGSSPSFMHVHNNLMYFVSSGIDTSWMVPTDHRDLCNSFRQSSFDPRVHFAVSDSNKWEPLRRYDCPIGYHWASTEEAYRHFPAHDIDPSSSNWHSEAGAEVSLRHGIQEYTYVTQWAKSTTVERDRELKVYQDSCGWNGLRWNNKQRTHFRFSDSHITGAFKHAGLPDSYRPDIDTLRTTNSLWRDEFAGIVCIAGDSLSAPRNGVYTSPAGSELWASDGTVEGTYRVADIYPGSGSSDPADLVTVGIENDKSIMYFSANHPIQGRELYRYTGDGRINSVELVSIKGTTTGIRTGIESSNPTDLTVAPKCYSNGHSNHLFFGANDGFHGRELWFINHDIYEVDYIRNYPFMIDIEPGSGSSDPGGFEAGRIPLGGGDFMDCPVFFRARTSTNGYELWQTDGTEVGTTMIADICPGSCSSTPRYLTFFKNRLYFQADDGSLYGRELYYFDPSLQTFEILADIRPGVGDSAPSFLTIMRTKHQSQEEEYLYMVATDGKYVNGISNVEGLGGSQIWVTDGTRAGTQRAFQKTPNDFYFDFESMDLTHPARMGTNNHGLYISANYGTRDNQIPEGGFDPAESDTLMFGFDQAVAIEDVDTSPSGNVTLVLSVDKGLIILKQNAFNSPTTDMFLRILVVDNRDTVRTMLFNSLTKLGHYVETSRDGESAYRMVIETYDAYEASKTKLTHTTSRQPFNCILLSLEFQGYGTGWDGLQTVRKLRLWEEGMASIHKGKGIDIDRPLQIFVMAMERTFPNQVSESLQAGADDFFLIPYSDYVPGKEINRRVKLDQGTFVEAGTYMETMERASYAAMAGLLQQKLIAPFRPFSIVASIQNRSALESQHHIASIDVNTRNKLPGGVVGNQIVIEGNLSMVNLALRDVYFFASNGINGNVSFKIEAIDKPLSCLNRFANLSNIGSGFTINKEYSSKNKPFRSTLYQRPAFPLTGSNDHHGVDMSGFAVGSNYSLCDKNNTNHAVRYLPVFVRAVNNAPEIFVRGSSSPISTGVNELVSITPLFVVDQDANELSVLSSFGFEVYPPMTMTISARYGRVSMLSLPSSITTINNRTIMPSMTITQGRGVHDRVITVRANLDVINAILSLTESNSNSGASGGSGSTAQSSSGSTYYTDNDKIITDFATTYDDKFRLEAPIFDSVKKKDRVQSTTTSAVQYVCRSMDGCYSGIQDTITVTIIDEGFAGTGGPLSDSVDIRVTIN